jgi:hypothetical protein
MRKHLMLGVALFLLAGCASTRPQSGSEANDQVLLVVSNESSVDLAIFLVGGGSARALGRVDRFDSRTFRVSRSSMAGPRVELRAFDESLHIAPTQVLGIAIQEPLTVQSAARLMSGPVPGDLARVINWRIGNATAVLQVR